MTAASLYRSGHRHCQKEYWGRCWGFVLHDVADFDTWHAIFVVLAVFQRCSLLPEVICLRLLFRICVAHGMIQTSQCTYLLTVACPIWCPAHVVDYRKHFWPGLADDTSQPDQLEGAAQSCASSGQYDFAFRLLRSFLCTADGQTKMAVTRI